MIKPVRSAEWIIKYIQDKISVLNKDCECPVLLPERRKIMEAEIATLQNIIDVCTREESQTYFVTN